MLTMLLSTKSLKVHITECKFAFAREIIYVSAKLFHANEFILASKIICPRRHEEHKLTIHICHENPLTVSENKQCVEYSMTHEYFSKFQYVNLLTLGVSVLQDSALIYKKNNIYIFKNIISPLCTRTFKLRPSLIACITIPFKV